MDFWLLFWLVVAAIVLSWVFQHFAHRKKVARFTAYAAQRGWQYTEKDRELVDRFDGQPFGTGRGRRVRHVLTGPYRGREVLAFEYMYKESSGSGDNSSETTYYFTVVSVGTPGYRPKLEVTREGLGRKLLGFVGIRDLQLESEEFNKAFHIKAEDEKFAYDVLHPRMMEWMLAEERARNLPFRFERSDLVTWQSGRIDPSTVDHLLEYVCDVLDRTPPFLWKS